jgi:hypothetical protein
LSRGGRGAAAAIRGIIAKAAKAVLRRADHPVVAGGAARSAAKSTAKAEARQALIAELKRNGVKFTEKDLIRVGRDRTGRIVFLEKGHKGAGREHIVGARGTDFVGRGVQPDEVLDYVWEAATKGTVVGTQGTTLGSRDVYAFAWKGELHLLAVSVGDNGYVVGANPVGRSARRRLGL